MKTGEKENEMHNREKNLREENGKAKFHY